MAGLLVGNLVGGVFADQRGRRDVIIIGSFGLTLFSVLAAAPFTAPSFVLYVTWRVAAGICTGAYGLVSFTLPAELVSSAERGFVNVITTVAFALGVASLAPLAYFIRDWRMLSLVSAAPGLVGFYYYM
jgi:MFS family permease